jgi:hypothetical protein
MRVSFLYKTEQCFPIVVIRPWMLVFSLFLMNVSVGLSPDDEKRTELVLVAFHFCDRLTEGNPPPKIFTHWRGSST